LVFIGVLVDVDTAAELRRRAASDERSVSAEARVLLRQALAQPEGPK